METLKRTPLYEEHKRLNAKIVHFAGFEMPLQFTSIVDEHVNVRTKVGIFDVSHMGEIWIKGNDSLKLVQKISSNNAKKLSINQIQYSGLLTEEGTFVDDMLVYKVKEDEYLLVVNASNTNKDYEFIKNEGKNFDVIIENKSDSTAQIAIQGPNALSLLSEILKGIELSSLKYYWFGYGDFNGEEVIVSRTGYTGEDGFEVYLSNENAPILWRELIEKGTKYGVKPAGLGARDTLRLEACMALYGNDIDQTTTPLEADLAWILKFDKEEDFNGKAILLKQKEEGIKRKLIAFELIENGIPRHGMECYDEKEKIGVVTSGTMAPFLKKPIGMAYLRIDKCDVGNEFFVDIRGKKVKAKVVNKPFYKREKR